MDFPLPSKNIAFILGNPSRNKYGLQDLSTCRRSIDVSPNGQNSKKETWKNIEIISQLGILLETRIKINDKEILIIQIIRIRWNFQRRLLSDLIECLRTAFAVGDLISRLAKLVWITTSLCLFARFQSNGDIGRSEANKVSRLHFVLCLTFAGLGSQNKHRQSFLYKL